MIEITMTKSKNSGSNLDQPFSNISTLTCGLEIKGSNLNYCFTQTQIWASMEFFQVALEISPQDQEWSAVLTRGSPKKYYLNYVKMKK